RCYNGTKCEGAFEMAAAAKRRENDLGAAYAAEARNLRLAGQFDRPVEPEVHRHHAELAAVFTDQPPRQDSYPGWAKLTLMVGPPALMWAALVAGAHALKL